MRVAPYTGAWIEIVVVQPRAALISVAPYTGAWIEINSGSPDIKAPVSLPTRERGLKYEDLPGKPHVVESLPTRERGLK